MFTLSLFCSFGKVWDQDIFSNLVNFSLIPSATKFEWQSHWGGKLQKHQLDEEGNITICWLWWSNARRDHWLSGQIEEAGMWSLTRRASTAALPSSLSSSSSSSLHSHPPSSVLWRRPLEPGTRRTYTKHSKQTLNTDSFSNTLY